MFFYELNHLRIKLAAFPTPWSVSSQITTTSQLISVCEDTDRGC